MLDYLFVYGTLRKAKDNSVHPYLAKALFINDASVTGTLYNVAHYPGAVLDSTKINNRVRGEVYRLLLPEEQLKQLDVYEECADYFLTPHEYQRIQTDATLADGNTINVWIYVFRHAVDGLMPITSGDFLTYLPASHLV